MCSTTTVANTVFLILNSGAGVRNLHSREPRLPKNNRKNNRTEFGRGFPLQRESHGRNIGRQTTTTLSTTTRALRSQEPQ